MSNSKCLQLQAKPEVSNSLHSQHEFNDTVTEYLLLKGHKCTLKIFYRQDCMKM